MKNKINITSLSVLLTTKRRQIRWNYDPSFLKNTLGYLIINYQMFLKLQDFVMTKAQKRGGTFKELEEEAFIHTFKIETWKITMIFIKKEIKLSEKRPKLISPGQVQR